MNLSFCVGIDEEDSGTPTMQQSHINHTNRIQQTPTPPPQSHQQSAPLLAQLQTPTSSSQVNNAYDQIIIFILNLIVT